MITKSDLLTQEIICILEDKLKKDYKKGNTKRDAHPKGLGLVKAYFKVDENLPEELRVGIFQPGKIYSTFIRFSSSGNKVKSDKIKDIRGMAIKLVGVDGKKYSNDENYTQDFVMITMPTMPIGTLELFRDVIYYTLKKKNPIMLLYSIAKKGNIKDLKYIIKRRRNQTSPLDIRYWSTTPYKFGNHVVKYSAIPNSEYKSKLPNKLTTDYLSKNMQKHLDEYDAIFDFLIQFQLDEKEMPINDSSIKWDEKKSPFIKVAEIIIPKQSFRTKERENLEENLSFSPGHSLLEHKPLGDINIARSRIYRELSRFRHMRNDEQLIEPTEADFKKLM